MTETVRMDVEELLVDPSRFAVRSVPVDEAQVDQLALAIEAGETLRPLVVAPASDPLAAQRSISMSTPCQNPTKRWKRASTCCQLNGRTSLSRSDNSDCSVVQSVPARSISCAAPG